MTERSIYRDISQRTNGDIYIGVVGPVRTGKSTFIKKFMDTIVIPNIKDDSLKVRTNDELPQSSGGRTIMTTEPKFIPEEAMEISLPDKAHLKVRMIDCVGYVVKDSMGYMEDDMPRMVRTPWSQNEIPFTEAAKIGTDKVITEHSTIGMVITTDGTITDIPRQNYEKAEQNVISELKKLNKPFVVLLNSVHPEDENTMNLSNELSRKYDANVMPIDISKINQDDLNEIFERVLNEFPVTEIGFKLPEWFSVLDIDHPLKQEVIKIVKENFYNEYSLREIKEIILKVKKESDVFESINIDKAKMEDGCIKINMNIKQNLFYKVLTNISNFKIDSDIDIFNLLKDFSKTKSEYDKIAMALEEVRVKGYGIVTPQMDELKLEEPQIVKQGNKYGVKLKASAPSIHMIRADIETEVSPIVGSEKQSEDLVKYLLSEFETDPKKIWESNIFGKSLHELVNEGLHNKLYRMPDEAQMKLQETLQKIINEGSGGLICIIL